MAKGKRSTGKNYTSKGERPNVTRSTILAMREERKKNPELKAIFQRLQWRETVKERKHDKSLAHLRERYIYEDMVESRANQLFEKFGSAGATWGACVQAVKTDWISEFENKWLSIKSQKNQK